MTERLRGSDGMPQREPGSLQRQLGCGAIASLTWSPPSEREDEDEERDNGEDVKSNEKDKEGDADDDKQGREEDEDEENEYKKDNAESTQGDHMKRARRITRTRVRRRGLDAITRAAT